jgi:3alpha(or 20beta)-hydroxysteroid dehydrogenase
MGRLDHKVAIVTGGARGQGAATAEVFAAEGAIVYLTDIDRDLAEATARTVGATFLEHDVADPASWAAVVERTLTDHGRIDVLVNNAAIIEWKTMASTDLGTWQRIIDINQTGPFLGMQAVAPTMTAQGRGSIVNISSIGGMRGSSAVFAYGATKWALRGMTRGAAQELGPHGVRVNAVLPGTVESRMISGMDADDVRSRIPLRRIAEPREVALLSLWLASDESSYANGADFVVDGGATT